MTVNVDDSPKHVAMSCCNDVAMSCCNDVILSTGNPDWY